MERLPQFSECGCWSLRRGTLTIGITSLICSCLTVTIMSLGAFIIFHFMRDPQVSPHDRDRLTKTGGLEVATAALFTLQATFDAFLIVGAVKERAGYLRLWVISKSISHVIAVVLVLGIAVVYGVIANIGSTAVAVVTIIGSIVVTGYYVLVVNSYHTALKGKAAHGDVIAQEN